MLVAERDGDNGRQATSELERFGRLSWSWSTAGRHSMPCPETERPAWLFRLSCPAQMQRATTFTICHQWLFSCRFWWRWCPLSVNGDPLHPMPACTVAVAFGRTRRTLHYTGRCCRQRANQICHHSNSTYMRTAPADPSIHKSTAAEAHAGPASCRRGRVLLLLRRPCACSHQIPSAATCNCSYPAGAAWHDAPCQKQQQQQRRAPQPIG